MQDPPQTPDVRLIQKTAALARLAVTEEEAQALAPQFARILEQFQDLAELPVEGVEPMTGATPLEDVTRADEPRASLPRAELLANAPDPREEFYAVPKTIGGAAEDGS